MLPERVWFDADAGHWEECQEGYSTNCVEYIRADVAQAQLGELDAKHAAIIEQWKVEEQMWRAVDNKQLARIAELEAAQAWVSVDERLPEPLTDVIVWNKDDSGDDLDDFEFAYYQNDHGWVVTDLGHKDLAITYWMPLPPPPQA